MADGFFLRHGRIGARLAVFERRQDGAQRRDQLVTGDVALAELDSQAESLVLRLEVIDEWLGPRARGFFFAAFAASLIAGQAALSDAVHGLDHFLLGWLAGYLEQQRFENNSLIRAAPAQRFGDISERKRLRNRRACLADLAGDVVVSIVILRCQAVQPFGLFERRQVFALEVFNEGQLKGFGVVSDLFDAGQLAKADGPGCVIATLAGDDVVTLLPRHEAHQQRLQYSLFFDRVAQFAQVAEGLPRLIGVRPNLIYRDHAAHCRAAVTGQRFDVVRVMPHLQCDGQSDLFDTLD